MIRVFDLMHKEQNYRC